MASVVKKVSWFPQNDRASQKNGETTETRVYRVCYCAKGENSATQIGTPLQALTATDGTTSVPAMMSSVDGMVVINKDAQRQEELTIDVSVTLSLGGVLTGTPGSVWNVDISGTYAEETAEKSHDGEGNLVINSVGDPVYPPRKVKLYYPQYSISYSTDNLDLDVLDGLVGKVNSDEVSLTIKGKTFVFLAHQLLFGKPDWEISYHDGSFTAFKVKLNLLRAPVTTNPNDDTWFDHLVDRGFNELISGKLVPIVDREGTPVTTPAFLDGSGRKLDTTTHPVAAVFYPDPNGYLMFEEAAFLPLLGPIG